MLSGCSEERPWLPGVRFKQPRRSIMLGKADATPMIAVTDLDRARKFYEDKLGLKTEDDWGEGFTLKSGDTLVNVYRSEFAGTNKATALTFEVDDAEKEVGELKEKGIFFEKYDLPGLEPQGDLYVGEGGFKTAWFKDPDGNILSLIEGED
jgi:catechol 2,3-dioxygenase-like lactoylglutathione lyase family enzyme